MRHSFIVNPEHYTFFTRRPKSSVVAQAISQQYLTRRTIALDSVGSR